MYPESYRLLVGESPVAVSVRTRGDYRLECLRECPCQNSREGEAYPALVHGYAPEKPEKATQKVLEQAEVVCEEWVEE